MAIIKIKEIIGTSPKSFEEAIKEAINHAAGMKKNVTGAKVVSQTVDIKNGRIEAYKVAVKIAYLWDKEEHQK